jgi:hypothetical protein
MLSRPRFRVDSMLQYILGIVGADRLVAAV